MSREQLNDSVKYNVKAKRKDTGKYWSFGKLKWWPPQGEKRGNWNLGLKKTAELKQLFDGVQDGQWINLSLFVDEYSEMSSMVNSVEDKPVNNEHQLNDEIPF